MIKSITLEVGQLHPSNETLVSWLPASPPRAGTGGGVV